MVKAGLPIRGKRMVIAGTGPLLLAVAAYLRKHGAEIPLICEQASVESLARFGLALALAGKIVQGIQLKRDLAGVPFAANSWVLAAHGEQTSKAWSFPVPEKSRASRAIIWPAAFIWYPMSNCPRCSDAQSTTVSCR